jgi:hypothetical protein
MIIIAAGGMNSMRPYKNILTKTPLPFITQKNRKDSGTQKNEKLTGK